MRPKSWFNRKGSAMVELALSTGVMLPCVAGAFQFGYGLYTYNRLESAVANGARYGAIRTYRALSGATDLAKVNLAIQNVAVYGAASPATGAIPVVPGLTADKVNVSWSYTSGFPSSVAVKISSYKVDAVFTSYTVAGKPIATFPYVGRYAKKESEP